MSKKIVINVSTIDGQIQDEPVPIQFNCDGSLQAVGESIVRDYDARYCIVAKKVFLFRVGQKVFGSHDFTTYDEFAQYVNTRCRGGVTINDCFVEINQCFLSSVNR